MVVIGAIEKEIVEFGDLLRGIVDLTSAAPKEFSAQRGRPP